MERHRHAGCAPQPHHRAQLIVELGGAPRADVPLHRGGPLGGKAVDRSERPRHRIVRERDAARAADLAVAARAVSLAANSNYGRALRAFHRGFLPAVTRRTTVIVVGDGRNNYNAPEAWVLDELRRKAKRLLWICPEDRAAWGLGDSEMPVYAARCDRVATAATLEELEGIAEALVPRR